MSKLEGHISDLLFSFSKVIPASALIVLCCSYFYTQGFMMEIPRDISIFISPSEYVNLSIPGIISIIIAFVGCVVLFQKKIEEIFEEEIDKRLVLKGVKLIIGLILTSATIFASFHYPRGANYFLFFSAFIIVFIFVAHIAFEFSELYQRYRNKYMVSMFVIVMIILCFPWGYINYVRITEKNMNFVHINGKEYEGVVLIKSTDGIIYINDNGVGYASFNGNVQLIRRRDYGIRDFYYSIREVFY